jgi:hypothetical protein
MKESTSHLPTMFIATFADGYSRKIMTPAKTLFAATKYAKNLETWFVSGGQPERVLVSVKPA